MATSGNPSITRKTVIDAATSLYGMTSGYASPRLETGSKRSMLAGTAASLIGMGLDKLETTGTAKGHYSVDGELSSRQSATQHFSDKLISKLINNAIPLSERGEIDMKMEDRSSKPGLSIRTITKNFKTLSYKMDFLFSVQYGIVYLLTWKRPTLTLFVLVLYSWACIDPYMFLVYPLWCILAFLLVPNYLHRHPVDTPEILKVRGRGSSMFGFLKEDKEWKLEQEQLEERRAKFEQLLYSDLSSIAVPENGTISDTESEFDDSSLTTAAIAEVIGAAGQSEGEENGTKEPFVTSLVAASLLKHEDVSQDEDGDTKVSTKVSKKVKLLINMRDLQNLTSDIIELIERYQTFVYEAASFVDEKKSTQLFYHVLSLLVILFVFGPYIPWTAIFILVVWIALLAAHPQRKAFWKMITDQATKRYVPAESPEASELFDDDEDEEDDEEEVDSGSFEEDKSEIKLKPPPLPPRENSDGTKVAPVLPDRPVRDFKEDKRTETNSSIIVDEEIQYREAEIYEVQLQGLTHYHYKPFSISTQIFNMSSETRTQKKRPKGVPVIDMVQPPPGWQYDPKYKWEVDLSPIDWCLEKGVSQEVIIHEDESEGWAYDTNNEYRRRRLTRTCVLTARPPKKMK